MTEESEGQMLCRLLAAWIHGIVLDPADPLDYGVIYQAANRHMLSATACAALEKTGLMSACPSEVAWLFHQAKAKALRRTILMETEQKEILSALEKRGIWYASLKGSAINSLYPEYGTRWFADVDLLFNAECARDVRDYMKGRGYKVYGFGLGKVDSYRKRPIYHFEMHRKLFSDDGDRALSACATYYANVEDILIKDKDNQYGWHLSDEDHYVFIVAHAFKHHVGGGTGLRSLLDLWLYRQKEGLDERRINTELNKLGLSDFERECRQLSEKLFFWSQDFVNLTDSAYLSDSARLTESETELLAEFESAGVHGTMANAVQNRLREIQQIDGVSGNQAKFKYLTQRIFPSTQWYEANMPFAGKHHWAIPFFWAYRLFRGVFKNGRNNFHALKMLIVPPDGHDRGAHE